MVGPHELWPAPTSPMRVSSAIIDSDHRTCEEAALQGCEGRTDVVLQVRSRLDRRPGGRVPPRREDSQQDQPAEPFGDPSRQGR